MELILSVILLYWLQWVEKIFVPRSHLILILDNKSSNHQIWHQINYKKLTFLNIFQSFNLLGIKLNFQLLWVIHITLIVINVLQTILRQIDITSPSIKRLK
jgi:hypothetical protein